VFGDSAQHKFPKMSIADFYGGAIKFPVPETFRDVSDFRAVPDYQEVWFSPPKNESYICELLALDEERDLIPNIKQRFADLAVSNNVRPQDVHIYFAKVLPATAKNPKLPSDASLTLLVGCQKAAKFNEAEKFGESALKHVDIIMVNLRIPSAQTDLLLTWNVPHELMHVKSTDRAAPAPAKQQGTTAAVPDPLVNEEANTVEIPSAIVDSEEDAESGKPNPGYCQAIGDGENAGQKLCPFTDRRVAALQALLPQIYVADWGLFA